MAIDVPEMLPATSPKVTIGEPNALLIVGDSFDREYTFEDLNGVVADFTGFTPTAEILDANGTVLDTFAVAPTPGDTTGTFRVVLTNAEIVAGLVDVAVKWKLTISFGFVTKTLICADFTVSKC